MKIITGLLFSILVTTGGIYAITIDLINGQTMTLSSYQGKRIVVIPFNGRYGDRTLLPRLDSLQRKQTDSLVVIAVPAVELDSGVTVSYLQRMSDSLALNIMIAKPVPVKKMSGPNQHPLFAWLSNVSGNTHFDRDVEAEGQFYVVSKKGTLYAVLRKDVSTAVLQRVLSQNIKE